MTKRKEKKKKKNNRKINIDLAILLSYNTILLCKILLNLSFFLVLFIHHILLQTFLLNPLHFPDFLSVPIYFLLLYIPSITLSVMNIEWNYNYYQPWSDNEWLVDEMLAMLDKDIIMQ